MSKNKKVALVTGGNRGIGYELVKQLAMKDFTVILASRDPGKGQAASTVNEEYARLDVLINNAGIYLEGNERLVNMEASILEKTMATNFFGAYHVIRSFIPRMEKQGYGRIITISSEYGAAERKR